MADKTTLLLAVSGIDPQPMSKSDFWYQYYTFLPKEESVDDGNLVQVGGKVYEANPFGLYCMHGKLQSGHAPTIYLIHIKKQRNHLPNIRLYVEVRISNVRSSPPHTHVKVIIHIRECLTLVSA